MLLITFYISLRARVPCGLGLVRCAEGKRTQTPDRGNVLLQQGGPSNIFVPEQKPRQTRQRQNQMADISAQGDTYTIPASAPRNAKDTASTVTIDGADGNSAEINLADPQAINDYVDSGPTIRSLRAFRKLQAPHLGGAVIDKMGAGQLGRVISIAAMLVLLQH